MNITGENIIGGSLSGKGKRTFMAINPATGKELETEFIEATQSEIEDAANKAREAFPVYSQVSGKDKGNFLTTIANEIIALGDTLIHRCMDESGLSEVRLIGERGRTVNQLKLFSEFVTEGTWVDAKIDTALPDRKPTPRSDIRSISKAIGPVGIFGASNFPFAFSVAGGDTASALAAGCPVIVKAHPAHPGTCELVSRAIRKAAEKCNMPEGVFSMLQGASHEVGLALVKHPKIKAIGFTGSYQGGKALFDEANKRPEPIPVYAEMGSTNPVFILPGAMKKRKESVTEGLAGSVTLGVGQFCTKPGLIFHQQYEDTASFYSQLAERIRKIPSEVMLTEGIRNSYLSGLKNLTDLDGVEVVTRGITNEDGFRGETALLKTTASIYFDNDIVEEEIFGPSTILISASGKDELLRTAEKLQGHLTATIHGTEEDLAEYADLIDILQCKVGRIIFNGYPTGVEVCHSMVHGGPFPATTDSKTTSVGTMAIHRFVRPVCFQDFPSAHLPDELKDENPLDIWRLVNGTITKNSI